MSTNSGRQASAGGNRPSQAAAPLARGGLHSSSTSSAAAERELTPKPSTSHGQQSFVDAMASQDSGSGAGNNAGASSAGAGSGGGARPRDDGSNLPPGAAGEREMGTRETE